jgi:hypothetical protein
MKLSCCQVGHCATWVIVRTDTVVPPRERNTVNTKIFRDFSIQKSFAWLARIYCFNRGLDWIYIGRVIA